MGAGRGWRGGGPEAEPRGAAGAAPEGEDFMANRWGNSGNSVRLFFLGSKTTADGDCSHEIKRCLLLGRKVMINIGSVLKKQRHYFASKGPSNKGYGFSSNHVGM